MTFIFACEHATNFNDDEPILSNEIHHEHDIANKNEDLAIKPNLNLKRNKD